MMTLNEFQRLARLTRKDHKFQKYKKTIFV